MPRLRYCKGQHVTFQTDLRTLRDGCKSALLSVWVLTRHKPRATWGQCVAAIHICTPEHPGRAPRVLRITRRETSCNCRALRTSASCTPTAITTDPSDTLVYPRLGESSFGNRLNMTYSAFEFEVTGEVTPRPNLRKPCMHAAHMYSDGADSRRCKELTSGLVPLMREISWMLLVMSRTHPVAQ